MLGDLAGSRYEFSNNRRKPDSLFARQCQFTDDSLLTVAVFEALKMREEGRLLHNLENTVLALTLKSVFENPDAGWGLRFLSWARFVMADSGLSSVDELLDLDRPPLVYESNKSCGNGAAMKISPVAYFAKSLEECKELTKRITSVTHDHPESYRAAECLTTSMYLATQDKSREEIRKNILSYYPEVADMTYERLNKEYQYTELAQDTVPQAMACFLESESFQDSLEMAISIGGDADTIGAITGALAEAYYGWADRNPLGLFRDYFGEEKDFVLDIYSKMEAANPEKFRPIEETKPFWPSEIWLGKGRPKKFL